MVKIKWNNTNEEWYKSKGYVYTKRNDIFEVKAKDLSIRSSAKIKAVCDYCGNKYITQYASITNGRRIIQKDCCSNCTGKKSSEVSRKKRATKFIRLADKICEENDYVLLSDVNNYCDSRTYIHFVCPKHGKQTMMIGNFIRGHKCIKCSYEKRGENLKYDRDQIISLIESVNGNKWLNSNDYKDTSSHNLKILCSCGKTFVTSLANYTKRNVNKCFSCSNKESVGEQKIRLYLENNNITFVQEKRYDDCRDNKPLPFDFYLPDYNIIIEFDGLHHYENTMFGNYEITKKHDKIKDQYCQSHNIDLLRIPYWESKNIENIIQNKLNL